MRIFSTPNTAQHAIERSCGERPRRPGRLLFGLLAGLVLVLAAPSAHAQLTSSDIMCSDGDWLMMTITFDHKVDPDDPDGEPDSDQAPWGGNVPTGDPIAGRTIFGYDVGDLLTEPTQDADPTLPNFQPYKGIGTYFQAIDPASGCPTMGSSPPLGVSLIYDSEWTCTGGDCDPDLQSPNNQCAAAGPGVGNDGNPGDAGENCDFPEKEAAPPANEFPKDLVTNLLIIQENAAGGSCPAGIGGGPSSYCPDDCAKGGEGGTIRVIYDDIAPIEFIRSSHIDFEGTEGLDIFVYQNTDGTGLLADASGADDQLPPGSGQGDNAWAEINGQLVMIQAVCDGGSGTAATLADCSETEKTTMRSARRVDFTFNGSGAIDSFSFCYDPVIVPVTLSSFSAEPGSNGVKFEWTTATEMGTAGFHLSLIHI